MQLTRTRHDRLLSLALLVAGLVALVTLVWHHMSILGDGFWSIATGHWLFAHRELPRSDPFAFGSVGHWTIVSSGACVLFAALTDIGRLDGLMIFLTGVEAVAVWLLWMRAARATLSRVILLPLALFYVQVDAEDLSARGQILGDLGFILLLGLLGRLRDSRRVHPALIVVLASAWANLHLSFMAAIFVPLLAAGLISLEPRASRPAIGPFLLASALAAVGACATPYGPRYLLLASGTAFDPSTAQLDLFQSPNFHDPSWLVAPLLALVIAGARGRGPARLRVAEQAFLLVFLAAACKSRRFATALVAVEVALAGPLLDALWSHPRIATLLQSRPRFAPAVATIAVGVALLGGLGGPLFSGGYAKDPFHDVPIVATRIAREAHESRLAARQPFVNIVDPLHWGGYLAYEWMGKPKYFIDGRDHLALFGNGAFDDSGALWRGDARALELLDVYEAGVVLWERGQALDAMLRRDPRWRRIHEDAMAVVYVREASAH
jgi:hypothetical protein